MSKQELKLCPFCGIAPLKKSETLDERYAYARLVKYECPKCNCSQRAMGDTSKGGYADNSTVDERALAAWQQRYEPNKESK